jgi:hypothetical protein
MTVPTHFRRNSEIPGVLVLHYADLPEGDVRFAQGFKYTLPLRTILDLIDEGKVEQRFIRQALTQALQRGLIPLYQIDEARLNSAAQKMVDDVMGRVA